jgi:hypothetical protein
VWSTRECACDTLSEATVLRVSVKFHTGLLYKKLSSNGEFHKNLCSDRHTLPKSVKEFRTLNFHICRSICVEFHRSDLSILQRVS